MLKDEFLNLLFERAKQLNINYKVDFDDETLEDVISFDYEMYIMINDCVVYFHKVKITKNYLVCFIGFYSTQHFIETKQKWHREIHEFSKMWIELSSVKNII